MSLSGIRSRNMMYTHIIASALMIALELQSVWCQADEYVVQTTSGSVRGVPGQTQVGYLGVPYARPPVGELRFSAPVDPVPWDGVRDTNLTAPPCYQSTRDLRKVHSEIDVQALEDTFQEDCLYLDVYLPGPEPPELRDPLGVVVLIAGLTQDAAVTAYHNPARIAEVGNVVVVTFNHRVGAFAAYDKDANAVANLGLLDQHKALQWVKDNIEKFAGDPESITIMGELEGGRSVSRHVVSPLSVGLFSKAVSVDGVAAEAWLPRPENVQGLADEFVLEMGCGGEGTSVQIRECMMAKSSADIQDWTGSFPVVVDGAFLTDDPLTLLDQSTFQPVSYILGCSEGDLSFSPSVLAVPESRQLSRSDLNTTVASIIKSEGYPSDTTTKGLTLHKAVLDQYFPDFSDAEATLQGYQTLLQDAGCVVPVSRIAERVSSSGGSAFVFRLPRPLTGSSTLPEDWRLLGTPTDPELSRLFIKSAASFTRNGIPVYGDLASGSDLTWPLYGDSEEREYLRLQTPLTADTSIKSRPSPGATSFWTVLLPALSGVITEVLGELIDTSWPESLSGMLHIVSVVNTPEESGIFNRELMQWLLLALAVVCVLLLLGMIGAFFLYYDVRRQARKVKDDQARSFD